MSKSLKQQVSELEHELEMAEWDLEEAQREYDRIEQKLEDLKHERSSCCPRCEVKQSAIEEQNICCPYCGYCDFVVEGCADECPEHSKMAVVA